MNLTLVFECFFLIVIKDVCISLQTVRMPRSTISPVLSKFAEHTTVHGVPRIIRSKSKTSCFFWTLVCLASITAFSYYGYNILRRYLRYEKNVDMEISQKGIQFPQITVCNLNHISLDLLFDIMDRYDKFPWSDFESFSDSMMNYSKDTNEFVKKYFRYFHAIAQMQNKTRSEKNNTSFELQALDYAKSRKGLAAHLGKNETMNVSNPADLTILGCAYNSVNCTYEITEVFDAFFFKCHTLTIKKNKNETLTLYKAGLDKGVSLWLYAGKRPDEKSVPQLNNMRDRYLTFRYGIDDTAEPLGQALGARIVVHPHGTVPFPLKAGISVPTGSHTSIGFGVTNTIRIGKPYGACHESKTKGSLYHGYSYSLQYCQALCTQKVIIKQCKCTDIARPMVPGMQADGQDYPICSDVFWHLKKHCGNDSISMCDKLPLVYKAVTEEAACMETAATMMEDPKHYEEECQCYPSCDDIDFTYQISSLKWPRSDVFSYLQSYLGICFKNLNESREKIFRHHKKDLIKRLYFADKQEVTNRSMAERIIPHTMVVNVYISNINIMQVMESPGYGEEQMIADIGGMLGLFIGLSAIGLVEIIQLLIRICHRCCQKEKEEDQEKQDKLKIDLNEKQGEKAQFNKA